MNGSKSFIFLSVLVAVLALGVAYAAITSNLNITATATVAPDGSNFDVTFTKVTAATGTGTLKNEASEDLVVTSINGTTATFSVAEGCLKTVGQYVEAVYTVTNASDDLIANLSDITVETEDDTYVEFTASIDATAGKVLQPVNGTTTVTVRATLMKAPANATVTSSATLKFTATAQEA